VIRDSISKAFHGLGNIAAGGYDGGDSSRMRRDLGWDRRAKRDEDHLVGDATRSLMRQKASDLRRNNAVVAGVCDRLSLYTVGATGIIPQCKTKDKDWNKAAEQWWNNTFSYGCDARGRACLRDFQSMSVSLRPTHGGLYFQKLDDGTLVPIECERIQNPQDPAKAKGWVEGVQIDSKTGRILRYCVHSRSDNGDFSGVHPESVIESENIIPVIRPAWRPDQVREVSDLAPILPALQDIHEMNLYTLNSAKWQSMVLGFLKKQQGNGLNSMARGSTTPAANARQTFKFDWGEILEGLPGDDLEMKASTVPNTQHIPYIKLQYALCASALGFPYEFLTLDLSGLDFSRQKGMLLLVNFACRPWKQWLVDTMLRPVWNWRIAMAIRDGELPPAPAANGISEWNKVTWQFPEEPWIDRQEALQADILEWQAGQGTMSKFSARRGEELEETLRRKAEDIKLGREIEEEYELAEGVLINTQIPGQADPAKAEKEEEPATELDNGEKDNTVKENKWLM
jgi:lambda family phage portal protein